MLVSWPLKQELCMIEIVSGGEMPHLELESVSAMAWGAKTTYMQTHDARSVTY